MSRALPIVASILVLAGCEATSMIDAGADGSADTGTGADGGADAGLDAARIDAGTDAGVDAGTDAGTDAGADSATEAGMDAGADGGVDAETDAGVDAGTDAGVDAGTDAGVDAGTDAGVDAGPQCLAGTVMRPIVAPAVGDLVITEYLANPGAAASSDDFGKEWFEVLVTRDVDLNRLEIGRAVGTVLATFDSPSCLAASAGTYLVFANGDALTSGLPRVDYGFAFTLNNTSGGVFVGLGGALLDQIAYTSVPVAASRTLRISATDTVSNDAVTSFCSSTSAYDGTNLGSPGASDPACP